ncbi:MAG TPA: hypothetical protein VF007_06010 [Stellaceae bacterium]
MGQESRPSWRFTGQSVFILPFVAEVIAHETATRALDPAERAGYAAAARWLV